MIHKLNSLVDIVHDLEGLTDKIDGITGILLEREINGDIVAKGGCRLGFPGVGEDGHGCCRDAHGWCIRREEGLWKFDC